MAKQTPPDDPRTLRATFDAAEPLTVGIEEELMLLDPATLDLAPVAPRVLERLGGDERFKLELPASQLEIALPPARTVPELATQLAAARRDAAAAADGIALLAGAGLHPFAEAEGEMNPGERFEQIEREYGAVARRQLVFALPGPRRRGRRGPHARGLQRAARAPARARRAGRQRAVPRRPRHRVRLVPADRSRTSFRARAMPPAIASWE